MVNKKSTCLYINKEILKTAKRIGLNISKVSENALVEMIGRLNDQKLETGLGGPPKKNRCMNKRPLRWS